MCANLSGWTRARPGRRAPVRVPWPPRADRTAARLARAALVEYGVGDARLTPAARAQHDRRVDGCGGPPCCGSTARRPHARDDRARRWHGCRRCARHRLGVPEPVAAREARSPCSPMRPGARAARVRPRSLPSRGASSTSVYPANLRASRASGGAAGARRSRGAAGWLRAAARRHADDGGEGGGDRSAPAPPGTESSPRARTPTGAAARRGSSFTAPTRRSSPPRSTSCGPRPGARGAAGRAGLIHGDLHQENYLFERGTARAIDFDDCGWGFFLYDVAVTLSEIEGRPRYAELRDALLDEYAGRRSLPANADEPRRARDPPPDPAADLGDRVARTRRVPRGLAEPGARASRRARGERRR